MIRLITCRKCEREFVERLIHDHHIIPKYCFPEWYKENGKFDEIKYKFGKILICKSCHDEIHELILRFGEDRRKFWAEIPEEIKLALRKAIKDFTLEWIE